MARFSTSLMVALVLGACGTSDSGPAVQISTSADPETAYSEMFVQVAVASFLGNSCGSQGIKTAFGSLTQAVNIGERQLRKAGYDEAGLARARVKETQKSADDRAGAAIDYLQDRGARPSDLSSACQVGLQEIEKQTFVGTLLRRV